MILTTVALVAQASPSWAFPWDIDAEARRWFDALESGTAMDRRELMIPEEAKAFDKADASPTAARLRRLGAPTAFDRVLTRSGHGTTEYTYRVAYAGGTTTLFTMVLRGGRLAGLWFNPATP